MNEKNYPLVTNPRDPRFLQLRFLQTPKGRSSTGNYLIEGIRHLARAVENKSCTESLFVEPSILSNPFGRKLVRLLRRSGVPAVRLSRSLYTDLTLAAEPQGVGAVLRQSWTCIADVRVTPASLFLAVESIESAGNLGTIIRTAEAAGVGGIFILNSTTDPYDPAAVRSSMGSLFGRKLIRCSTQQFLAWTRSAGIATVGSSPAGLLNYRRHQYRWPAVLMIGNERCGLSEQLIAGADLMVRIPMHGACDSINAAVAAGVLLFEMTSQRSTE